MKKFLTKLFAGLLSLTAVFGLAACNGEDKGDGKVKASFYTPDGAPALAIAKMIDGDKEVSYNVVKANTIATFVTGEEPKADFCILPITAASKLLGTGEKYTMLATVTHGNLYLLSSDAKQYDEAAKLGQLANKAIGVFQPENVPGLTFEALLKGAGVNYKYTRSETIANDLNGQVGLIDKSLDTTEFAAILEAEPTVTKLMQESANTAKPLQIVGDIQQLYGDGNGFPQAVLVVKNAFLNEHEDWVKSYLTKFENSIKALNEATDMTKIVSALNGVRTEGLEPAITTDNMSAEVLQRCNVKFVSAANSKAAVTSYLSDLKNVKENAVKDVADKFFYVG